jgi:hypothetical protein
MYSRRHYCSHSAFSLNIQFEKNDWVGIAFVERATKGSIRLYSHNINYYIQILFQLYISHFVPDYTFYTEVIDTYNMEVYIQHGSLHTTYKFRIIQ